MISDVGLLVECAQTGLLRYESPNV